MGTLLLSVKEISRRFELPEQSTYRLIRLGTLRGIKIGRRVRVPETELLRFLQQCGGEIMDKVP